MASLIPGDCRRRVRVGKWSCSAVILFFVFEKHAAVAPTSAAVPPSSTSIDMRATVSLTEAPETPLSAEASDKKQQDATTALLVNVLDRNITDPHCDKSAPVADCWHQDAPERKNVRDAQVVNTAHKNRRKTSRCFVSGSRGQVITGSQFARGGLVLFSVVLLVFVATLRHFCFGNSASFSSKEDGKWTIQGGLRQRRLMEKTSLCETVEIEEEDQSTSDNGAVGGGPANIAMALQQIGEIFQAQHDRNKNPVVPQSPPARSPPEGSPVDGPSTPSGLSEAVGVAMALQAVADGAEETHGKGESGRSTTARPRASRQEHSGPSADPAISPKALGAALQILGSDFDRSHQTKK